MVGPIIATPLFFSFSVYFPNSCPVLNLRALILPLLTTLPLLVLVPTSFNVVDIEVIPFGVNFTPGPLYLLYLGYLIFFLALSCIKLLQKMKLCNALEKRQIFALGLGILIMSVTSSIMSLILPSLGLVKHHYISHLSTFVIISATYYALTRHRLFGIKLVIGKAIYLILLASITYGLFYLYYIVQEKYLEAAYRPYAIAGGFIIFAASIFILFTINKRLKRTVNYFIVNRKYDPEQETKRLTESLGNTLTKKDAIKNILTTINTTIEPKHSYLLFPSKDTFYQDAYAPFHDSKLADAILEEEITQSSPKSLQLLKKKLLKKKIKAIFPISIKQDILSLLFLSEKKDSSAYTLEEIQYLKGLCAISAVAFDRIQLHEKAKQIATLKAARKREQEIIDIMGHELRTPATVAKMAIEQAIHETANGSKKETLELALLGIDRQYQLAERYITAAKLSKGAFKIEKKPTDLLALTQKLIQQFTPFARENQLKIILQAEEHLPKTPLDPQAITQILSNLLENAIKYSHKGTVTISIFRQGNSTSRQVEVAVKDNGPGIPKKEIPNLGKRFFRIANRSTQNIPGTGLGLYIVFELVKAHGGKVKVESEIGQGTTISFSIQS